VNDTTDQQTPQYPRLSLQGDSTEITTRQQAVEEQDLGDTMEGGETIPESTPLHEQRSPMSQNPKEEEISTNKNVSMRHKAENKAGLSPEEADIEMVQIDEKGNREETRHNPRRLKKCALMGREISRPKENAARPDSRYINPTIHRYIAE